MHSKHVLVVDDHPLVLSGIKTIVKSLAYHVSGAKNAEQALDKLKVNSYDLILLDVRLPDIDGRSLLRLIKMSHEDTPVLIVSGGADTQDIMWMLDNGAQGYVDKAEPSDVLTKAIYEVMNGNSFVPYRIRSALNQVNKEKRAITEYVGITPRQKEVIVLVGEGKSNKEIARSMDIAESTVATHFKQIFLTLNVHNRMACVNAAKDFGII
jgi:DNA-binding NarL/FixJ family response regulator